MSLDKSASIHSNLRIERKTIKEHFSLFLKGIAMGAADVVPGVSGGTIAFITGIYDRLIHALSTFNFLFILSFLKGKFKQSYKELQNNHLHFFVPLGAGIIIALLVLSGIIESLLHNFPGETFAVFFGLIIASAIVLYRMKKHHKLEHYLLLALGFAFAYLLAGLTSTMTSHGYPILFLSGIIAISAMLLPGISGSFLLLLLGQYEFVLSAVHNFNLPALITFAFGAIIGLFAFAKVIDYFLEKHHSRTMYVLIGVMLGALRTPYQHITASSITATSAVLFAVLGAVLVFGLEWLAKKR